MYPTREPSPRSAHSTVSCADRATSVYTRKMESLTFSLQALLVRHETHMAESEAERLKMNTSIERLELEKRELEASNAKTIEENRNLLDQLEELNNSVSESDVHIQSLTATLHSTRIELQRLTVLAGRTAQLEAELAELETEQAALQSELDITKEGNRSSIQRWKRAEGTIGHLQEQIDKIEREAKEERERHMEVLGRMERQRVVEKELDSAAGRLKGAAALTSLERHETGNNVVSHFVKDILQDNANLQIGIVELREMLIGSNAEVENLRDQLRLHQPLMEGEDSSTTLNAELAKAESSEPVKVETEEQSLTENMAAFHVHHHYHGPEINVRKPKKKRAPIAGSHIYSSSSGTSTPRNQRIRDWRAVTASSAATILSQTSVTVPPTKAKRWSVQSSKTMSSFAPSSVPSSPRRPSSIFDNIDNAFDSSRPTTPESSVPDSPLVFPKEYGNMRRSNYRSISTPVPLQLQPITAQHESSLPQIEDEDKLGDIDDPNFSDNGAATSTEMSNSFVETVISPMELQERELINDASSSRTGTVKAPSTMRRLRLQTNEEMTTEEASSNEHTESPGSSFLDELMSKPTLRRAASHESILSMSGMDIHTLRERPSQVFGLTGRYGARIPYSPTTSSLASSKAEITPTTATFVPSFQRRAFNGGELTRSLRSQTKTSTENQESQSPSISKRVGGWMFGKWGATPVPSSPVPHSPSVRSPLEAMMRSPGVNQFGPIKGLKRPAKTPSNVQPTQINTALLEETLNGI